MLAVFFGVFPASSWAAAQGDRTPDETPVRRNLAYLSRDRANLKVTDLSKRRFDVIDIHEHVLDGDQAERLLVEMDRFRIRRTCLMGTSRYTFTLNDRHGFEHYLEHNEMILKIELRYPDRFCSFVTLHPGDAGNLERLKDYVSRGSDGLKLYLGHGGSTGDGPFHVMAIDDERMRPLYAWAERVQLPIMLHVNLLEYYGEFVRLMEAHPKLRICIPHFGLHKNTKARLDRLSALLDGYENLYSDIGFGWHTFHKNGFESLARWRTRSRKFLTRYAHRFMYASDMVIERSKDERYISDTLRSYFQLLETEAFRFFRHPELPMHGLDLPSQALAQIYWETPARFLLLDEEGNLPDRSSGGLPVGIPAPVDP